MAITGFRGINAGILITSGLIIGILLFPKTAPFSSQIKLGIELMKKTPINKTCPISGRPVVADSLTTYRGVVVGFCNPGCRDAFEKPLIAFDRLIDKKSS